ncbi:hypothetical protein [Costertonia aggregata]|uniref:Uncharacterized protein n=1 Tax=Costertonia aggregata TaxID=343403 RepID=A0A7H9APE8_9FLAO|nr:hypothetical protein [Costertonia aggregata]QLG45339.1 hypothetical protein HYG79_08255 [Costertonia aggregata]
MKAITLASMLSIFYTFQVTIGQLNPAGVSEIQFKGKYSIGPGPCEWLPNGTRRWARTTGFQVVESLYSDFAISYIEVSGNFEENQKLRLKNGEVYLVTLVLPKESIEKLGLNNPETIMTYKNPIKNSEIAKIENIDKN